MHNQTEYLDLIVRYLNHPEDERLHAEIHSFRAKSEEHEHYFNEVEKIWELSSQTTRLQLLHPKQAARNFRISLRALSPRRSGFIKWVSGIAATILIAGACFTLFYHRKTTEWSTIKTGEGQTDTVVLKDGSKIILAENSKLKYPLSFDTETRDVSLDTGKAFFLIAKDPKHAFRVHMGESRVSVLGTSFNLTYSKIKIDLDVKTGRVLFSPYRNTVSSILSAGQGLSYHIDRKQFTARASQNADSWLTKQLVFVDTPLEDVCQQLSDCYDVEIDFNPGKRIVKKFNATFKNEELGVILQMLKQTYNLKIKKEGTKLILKTP